MIKNTDDRCRPQPPTALKQAVRKRQHPLAIGIDVRIYLSSSLTWATSTLRPGPIVVEMAIPFR